ncbi:MAG TPA: hypothetical protein VIH35_07140, partial [Kiritimatiellia bacterium]
DSPVSREVAGADAVELAANFQDGLVTFVEPVSPSVNGAALQPGGQMGLSLAGNPWERYLVLASSNLVDWTPLTLVTNVTGTIEVTDPGAASAGHKFYRTVAPY